MLLNGCVGHMMSAGNGDAWNGSETPEEEPGGFIQSYFLIHLGSGCREVHLVRFPLTARENSLVVVHEGRATDTRPLLGFTASSQVLKVLFQCHVQSVSMKAWRDQLDSTRLHCPSATQTDRCIFRLIARQLVHDHISVSCEGSHSWGYSLRLVAKTQG